MQKLSSMQRKGERMLTIPLGGKSVQNDALLLQILFPECSPWPFNTLSWQKRSQRYAGRSRRRPAVWVQPMYGLLRSAQGHLVSGTSLSGAGGWGWRRQNFRVPLGSTPLLAVQGSGPACWCCSYWSSNGWSSASAPSGLADGVPPPAHRISDREAWVLLLWGPSRGFLGGMMVKNLPASAGDKGDTGSIPGSGRSPGGGNGNPLQYSCLGNPVDREAWKATSPWNQSPWTRPRAEHTRGGSSHG